MSLVTSSDFHLILDNLPTKAELPTFHVAPLAEGKNLSPRQCESQVGPTRFGNKTDNDRKESPRWPSSTAHPGCLRKSIFILLDFIRLALSYTGCEIKPRSGHLQSGFWKGLQQSSARPPHSTWGETEGLGTKVTSKVTQPIWQQALVPDSSIFHHAACQQCRMKHPRRRSQQHASPPKHFSNIIQE